MKVVRIAGEGDTARYGVVRGDKILLLDSQPWFEGALTGEEVVADSARLLSPVEPSKVICVGRNFMDHVIEMGFEPPAAPSLFLKPPTALIGPDDSVVLPPKNLSDEFAYEAELAVVIGKPIRDVGPGEVLPAVYGVTCANDVTARDLQRSDADLVRAKGFDTFCPIGPWIETEADVRSGLGISCRVNGELRQAGNTRDQIFSVPHLISYISQFATLLPGDVVLTGSPGGSGPLHVGDRLEIEIDGVGVLCHGVRR